MSDDRPADDPAEALRAAVCADSATRVRGVLEQHPELKSRLDDPLPNYAFGGTGAARRRAAWQSRDDRRALVRRRRRQRAQSLVGGRLRRPRQRSWIGVISHRARRHRRHAAARLGMFDRLDELVSANPDVVHARGGDGQTPLHVAASVAIAEYLVNRGADVDARDIDHESTPAPAPRRRS